MSIEIIIYKDCDTVLLVSVTQIIMLRIMVSNKIAQLKSWQRYPCYHMTSKATFFRLVRKHIVNKDVCLLKVTFFVKQQQKLSLSLSQTLTYFILNVNRTIILNQMKYDICIVFPSSHNQCCLSFLI